MVDASILQAAQELVRGVLKGEVSPEKTPALFSDDQVYIQVGIVEQNAPGWLRAQVQDERYSKDARLTVVFQMTGTDRRDLLKALGGPAIG